MSDLLPCPFCGGEAVKVDGFTVACAHGLCIGWTVRRASPHEWNTRALPAVQPDAAALDGARTALENIRELNLSGADEHGRKWANSDLIEQEIVAALDLIDRPAVQPDLTDPVVVHANMLRGTIAKPTLDQIIHLYGVDALCRALVPVIVKEAALDEMARLGQEFDAAMKGETP